MRTTEIIELLRRQPGAYIGRNDGIYWLKNSDGSDMAVPGVDPQTFFGPIDVRLVDDLVDAGIIVREGSKKYLLVSRS
jgi:hypothetical protein